MKKDWISTCFPYFLVLLGAIGRLLPHAPNFTPIAALALFGAVYLKKRDGLWVPLAAMAFSDFFIGFYHPLVMASVYGSFILTGLIGIWLKREKTKLSPPYEGGARGGFRRLNAWWMRIGCGSLLGSVLFFLITNWAVWAFGELYTRDLGGLIMSYTMGLPFFRNTLLGDLFYVAIFFGIAEVMRVWVHSRRRAVIVDNV